MQWSPVGGADALTSIEVIDSDGATFSNSEEIAALRYPGNPGDDPTKVAAPYRMVSLDEKGLSRKFDGCTNADVPDSNDWLTGSNEQLAVYWAIHELNVLLDIEH